MKKYAVFFLVIILVSILAGCGYEKKNPKDLQMFYMDTLIEMSLFGEISYDKYLEIEENCENIISSIEKKISKTIKNSTVSKLNNGNDFILYSDESEATLEVFNLIKEAFYIADITDRAFDPTVGLLARLWNITGREADTSTALPNESEIIEALEHSGTDKFEISSDGIKKIDSLAEIDLGGIGKGYAAQRVIEYLDSAELDYGWISVGGNIGVFGEKTDSEPFKIGIRDPDDSSGIVGFLYVKSGYISVSGDYERFVYIEGKRYHHIFDMKTGYSSESGLRSVAVHCGNGAYADALSTALFVMGHEAGIEFYNKNLIEFEAVFITSSGEIILTEGLKNEALFQLSSDKYVLND